MAIAPLNLPGYAAPQSMDFSSLGNLGQVYKKAQSESGIRDAFANGVPTDAAGLAQLSAQVGAYNPQLGMSLAQLGMTAGQRQQEQERQGRLDTRQLSRDAVSDKQHAESMALQRANAARLADRTPAGFAVNPDGTYRPIPGGPADPDYLDRKGGSLPAGFQRDPTSGGLRPIPGGPADPAYKRTVTDKQNAPSGYKWADPNNTEAGLIAIPGGPGEKIPAEVAARLGLAKSFLGQLPEIRKRVEAGEATGLVDGIMGAANMGGSGEIRRQIASGAEALLRNLTGAGMNIDEAKKYVARYQPEMNDSAKTIGSKLDQLERELRSVNDVVSQGRGGSVLERPSATQPRPPASAPISQQQYESLPSGSPFTAPDGTQRVKP